MVNFNRFGIGKGDRFKKFFSKSSLFPKPINKNRKEGQDAYSKSTVGILPFKRINEFSKK